MLKSNDATVLKKLKDIEKRLAKIEKQDLPGEIKDLGGEFSDEISSINKQIGPLFDKDAEADKRLTRIEKINRDVAIVLGGLRDNLSKIDKRVFGVEKIWNANTLKKFASEIGAVSDSLEAVEKGSKDVLKKLDKTNSGVLAITKHASDIGEAQIDAKYAAEELAKRSKNLAETLDYFSSQTDMINSKLGSNAASLGDVVSVIESLKQRLDNIESQTAMMPSISTLLNEQTRTVAQLANRLSYLEKATVKTVVLD